MAKPRRIRMYSLFTPSNMLDGRRTWVRIGACGLPLSMARDVGPWRRAVKAGRGVLRPTGHSWGPEVRP